MFGAGLRIPFFYIGWLLLAERAIYSMREVVAIIPASGKLIKSFQPPLINLHQPLTVWFVTHRLFFVQVRSF